MTDNEIIKALECCLKDDCENCPYFANGLFECGEHFYEDVLDLINRQKAEIERLEAKCENTQVGYNIARAETEEYKAINKSLKADRPFLIANARTEAVKEFAERFKWFLSEECGNVVEDNPNLDEIIFGYRKEEVDEYIENFVKK